MQEGCELASQVVSEVFRMLRITQKGVLLELLQSWLPEKFLLITNGT